MHGHQKKLADVVDLPSVGPITVVRRDLGSFGAPDMHALYALMHEIVDAYSDEGKAGDESARALMCVSEFQIYRALRPTGLATQDVHPPPHLLRPRVRVKGLKSRPALNGRCGYRDSYDDVKRRWHVYLDGKTGLDKPLGIRAENLEIFADKIEACAKSCANAVEDLVVAGGQAQVRSRGETVDHRGGGELGGVQRRVTFGSAAGRVRRGVGRRGFVEAFRMTRPADRDATARRLGTDFVQPTSDGGTCASTGFTSDSM